MAIRTVLTVLASNFLVAKSTEFHAGAYLARTSAGLVTPAYRSAHTSGMLVGFAADDKDRNDNTMIQVDPVGSTVLSSDGATFTANNNAQFVAIKRALADYQDETVTNVSNLTAGASGYEGPRRGVGVYTTPSTEFWTDQFVDYHTAGASSSDEAFAGADAYAINDLLTYAYDSARAGMLVQLASSSHGTAVARVDEVGVGMLKVTML